MDVPTKHVMAVSKAEYRGVVIFETEDGCAVVLNGKRYNCTRLDEAVALIDATYVSVIADPRWLATIEQ